RRDRHEHKWHNNGDRGSAHKRPLIQTPQEQHPAASWLRWHPRVQFSAGSCCLASWGRLKQTTYAGHSCGGLVVAFKVESAFSIVAKLIDGLRSFGIDANDMQTSSFNVSSHYTTGKDGRSSTMSGHTVTNRCAGRYGSESAGRYAKSSRMMP